MLPVLHTVPICPFLFQLLSNLNASLPSAVKLAMLSWLQPPVIHCTRSCSCPLAHRVPAPLIARVAALVRFGFVAFATNLMMRCKVRNVDIWPLGHVEHPESCLMGNAFHQMMECVCGNLLLCPVPELDTHTSYSVLIFLHLYVICIVIVHVICTVMVIVHVICIMIVN